MLDRLEERTFIKVEATEAMQMQCVLSFVNLPIVIQVMSSRKLPSKHLNFRKNVQPLQSDHQ